ncbi:MAG: hypothetical protein ABIH17_03610, partial [Pseudomonadota bacterium]
DRRSASSLLRYAALLEGTWQLAEASAIYMQLAALGSAPKGHEDLARYIDILQDQNHDWVVDPDLPVTSIIEATTVIGRPFVGRWLLLRSDKAASLRGPQLGADVIAAKYEQVKESEGWQDLPRANPTSLWWLSRGRIEQTSVVTFEDPPDAPTTAVRLLLQVRHDGLHNLVVPAAVLEAAPPASGTAAEDHNQQALATCTYAVEKQLAHSRLSAVNAAVTKALRRLHGEALAQKST